MFPVIDRIMAAGVIAMSGDGDFAQRGGGLATRVGTGRGGDYAAPAPRQQGKENTDIYDLSRHGFYFDRLINTRGNRLSIRERTDTPTGYIGVSIRFVPVVPSNTTLPSPSPRP
jgi:hypothetical protein